MRRTVTLLSATLLALALSAGPAFAWHEHKIEHTHPVTGAIRTLQVFPCEPAHIGNHPHPRHFGLHNAVVPTVVDARGEPGPITVRATGEECPT